MSRSRVRSGVKVWVQELNGREQILEDSAVRLLEVVRPQKIPLKFKALHHYPQRISRFSNPQ